MYIFTTKEDDRKFIESLFTEPLRIFRKYSSSETFPSFLLPSVERINNIG